MPVAKPERVTNIADLNKAGWTVVSYKKPAKLKAATGKGAIPSHQPKPKPIIETHLTDEFQFTTNSGIIFTKIARPLQLRVHFPWY